MNILRLASRGLAALCAIMVLVGVVGAGAATSGTAPLTNPKHFFWAQGQVLGGERRPERAHRTT